MLLTGRAYGSAGHAERVSGTKVWLAVGPATWRLSLVTRPHRAASREGGNAAPLTRLAHLSVPQIGGGLRGSKGKMGRIGGFGPNSEISHFSFYIFIFLLCLLFILNPKFEFETFYEFHL
jgi:hypothetical protein